jgi:hypothetical protein
MEDGGGWREGEGRVEREGGGRREKRAYPLPTLPAQMKFYTNPRANFPQNGIPKIFEKNSGLPP